MESLYIMVDSSKISSHIQMQSSGFCIWIATLALWATLKAILKAILRFAVTFYSRDLSSSKSLNKTIQIQ